MKFTVEAKPFAAALGIAGRVIEAKTPWPILSNVYLRASGNVLTIRGTNSDITYEAGIAAKIEAEGEALVSFAMLAKFISAARGDEISFEADTEKAAIKSGRGRIALAVADATAFPDYERASGDMVAVDPATFTKALRFCSIAVKPSDVKYHIAGVDISEVDGAVDMWGTDGQVAHHARLPHLPGVGGGGQVPLDAVGIILSIADKALEVSVIVTAAGWAINADGVTAWGKVIDAKFPNMAKALERFSDWREVAIADPANVAQAIDVAICGTDANSDKTRHVVLRCDEGMVLRGFKPGGGVVSAGRAEADATVRGPAALAINADYLKATINGLSCDSVSIAAAGEAIRIIPSQADSAIFQEGVIFVLRASEGDLADV